MQWEGIPAVLVHTVRTVRGEKAGFPRQSHKELAGGSVINTGVWRNPGNPPSLQTNGAFEKGGAEALANLPLDGIPIHDSAEAGPQETMKHQGSDRIHSLQFGLIQQSPGEYIHGLQRTRREHSRGHTWRLGNGREIGHN